MYVRFPLALGEAGQAGSATYPGPCRIDRRRRTPRGSPTEAPQSSMLQHLTLQDLFKDGRVIDAGQVGPAARPRVLLFYFAALSSSWHEDFALLMHQLQHP